MGCFCNLPGLCLLFKNCWKLLDVCEFTSLTLAFVTSIANSDPASTEFSTRVFGKGLQIGDTIRFTSSYNRAIRSKNSHQFQTCISRRVLCLLTWDFARSFKIYGNMLLQIFSSFCCAFFEIFDMQILEFSKIGVPYTVVPHNFRLIGSKKTPVIRKSGN